MAMERQGLAGVLKVLVGAVFIITLISGVLMAVFLPVAALGGEEESVSVPVVLGQRSLAGAVPVEVGEVRFPDASRFRLMEARGELSFETSSSGLLMAHAAVLLVSLAVFLWGLFLLRRILEATAGGRPFHPDNPKRLNLLGWIILVAGVGAGLLEYLSARWVLARASVVSPPLSPPVSVHMGWIISGLLLLILAAVWKDGARIAEEQSLTV